MSNWTPILKGATNVQTVLVSTESVGLGKMFGAIELTLLGPAVPAVTCDDIFVQNRETG